MTDAQAGSPGVTRSPFTLPVLCLAQFMVILDVTIVNVALPSIQQDLDVAPKDLQWVVIAYGLCLGGFLLLGGRLADLFGRRRMFMIGVSVFTLCSVGCALSQSLGMLVSFRALQGAGAAMTAPAALSLLTTVFAEGAERNKALGIWGALGGAGSAVGVLLGGTLTNSLSWEWIFLINVPAGALVLFAGPRVLPVGAPEVTGRKLDLPGALTVTSGLLIGVYGVNHSVDDGWTDAITLGCLVASVVLLGVFLMLESRSADPLLDLKIFRLRTVSVSNVLNMLVCGAMFAQFFMLSIYMQEVLGYSALRTGFAYLPIALVGMVGAGIASQAVTKVGPKRILIFGIIFATAGYALLSRLPADGDYLTNLLPAYVLVGLSFGFTLVPIQVAAFAGVPENEAGLAAGLINTSQEIGGALMVAVVATISFTSTRDYVASHATGPDVSAILPAALSHGFNAAFVVVVALGVLALVLAVLLVPGQDPPPPLHAPCVTMRPVTAKPIKEHRIHIHGHAPEPAPAGGAGA